MGFDHDKTIAFTVTGVVRPIRYSVLDLGLGYIIVYSGFSVNFFYKKLWAGFVSFRLSAHDFSLKAVASLPLTSFKQVKNSFKPAKLTASMYHFLNITITPSYGISDMSSEMLFSAAYGDVPRCRFQWLKSTRSVPRCGGAVNITYTPDCLTITAFTEIAVFIPCRF